MIIYDWIIWWLYVTTVGIIGLAVVAGAYFLNKALPR